MNVLAIAWLALGLVWAVGFGSRSALVAGERRRRRQLWFLFGAVLGPGALAILAAAPPGVCARCLSLVAGWSMTCAACGEDVRQNPMIDLMLGSEQLQPQPARTPMATTSDPAAHANDVPPSNGPPTRGRAAAARKARAKPGPAAEHAAEHLPTDVAPPVAQPASPRQAPPAPPVADATGSGRRGDAQLDLDMHRPMRLASCVFVEGTEALVPGMWYQLTTEGGALSISGPQGSLPNASAITRPLTEIKVQTKGDRLVVASVSDSDDDLRLVFKSTLDWTPLGLKREVEARRLELIGGTGDA